MDIEDLIRNEPQKYEVLFTRAWNQGFYQGKVGRAREAVFLKGIKQFGKVPKAIKELIEEMTDLEELNRITLRILDVCTCEALFPRDAFS